MTGRRCAPRWIVIVPLALAFASPLDQAAAAEPQAFEVLIDAETRRDIARFEAFSPGTCAEAEDGVQGPDGRALPRFVVASNDDGGGPGTLRAAVNAAARGGGGQIVFDLALTGATIALKEELRPGSGTVIDGGCRDITLSTGPDTSTFIVRDVRDVTIRGLRMEKAPLPYDASVEGDAITAYGGLERVVIEDNRFAWCGDGCVDVTRMTGGGPVTIRRNLFQNHNKVMAIATCFPSDAGGCPATARGSRFRIELLGNVFYGTGQRHPKVYGPVYLRAAGNLVIYRSVPYSNGRGSASYGLWASNGTDVLAEGNAFAYAGPAEDGTFAMRAEADGRTTLRGGGNHIRPSDGAVNAELAAFNATARCIVRRLSKRECQDVAQ